MFGTRADWTLFFALFFFAGKLPTLFFPSNFYPFHWHPAIIRSFPQFRRNSEKIDEEKNLLPSFSFLSDMEFVILGFPLPGVNEERGRGGRQAGRWKQTIGRPKCCESFVKIVSKVRSFFSIFLDGQAFLAKILEFSKYLDQSLTRYQQKCKFFKMCVS